jgi:NADH-quinone oxidoreductase subunit C
MDAAPPEAKPSLTQRLQAKFADAILGAHAFRGDETVLVRREDLRSVMAFLRDEPDLAFNFLMDVAGVDYLTYPEPKPTRYEVVYHLYSLRFGHRVRVKTPVAVNQSVPSVADLWESADWAERETWEMFGIVFDGHPNLERLLTHQDFTGWPLRKDYPTRKRQPLAESATLQGEMEKRLRFKGLK